MERFLLFSGCDYYPNGGWDDFNSSFDTIAEADEYGKSMVTTEASGVNWFHVIDADDGEKVAEGWIDGIKRSY